MAILCFIWLIFLPFLIKTQNNCLSLEENLSSLCLLCKYGFYSRDFPIKAGILAAFDPDTCLIQSEGPIEVKEFFIADVPCDKDSSLCDGSLSSPFNNIYEALKAGQLFSHSFLSS